MPFVCYGSNLLLRSRRIRRTAKRGTMVFEEWTGTHDGIMGKANGLNLNLVDFEIDDSDAPLFRLYLATPEEAGQTNVPVPRWELRGNSIQRDAFEHRRSRAISAADQKSIQAYLRSDRTGTKPTFTDENANELLRLCLLGTAHFQDVHLVLRQLTVGTGVEIRGGTGLVYTTQYLISVLQSSAPSPGLPDEIAADMEIADADAQAQFGVLTNYTWGWLMQASSKMMESAGRYELVQEWWFGQWSNYYYDLAVP